MTGSPRRYRDLELPARIVQVQRRAGSVVEVTPAGDPCAQLLADAGALAAGDHVPLPIASRVVPGICRTALETACIELTRRRRLARGDTHAEIEAILESTKRLLPKLALAVLDDESRAGEVYGWLGSHVGSWAPSTVKACNEGAHSTIVDAGGLVGDTRRLIDKLRERRYDRNRRNGTAAVGCCPSGHGPRVEPLGVELEPCCCVPGPPST